MILVMLDHDIAGHQDLLAGAMQSTGWDKYEMGGFITMTEAGLADNTIDREIWRYCQRHGLILLTANRNQDDPDSLEQTLREENTPDSLPVITISDQQRIAEQDYRERCIHALISIVFDLENYLGSARQYIP